MRKLRGTDIARLSETGARLQRGVGADRVEVHQAVAHALTTLLEAIATLFIQANALPTLRERALAFASGYDQLNQTYIQKQGLRIEVEEDDA